MARPIPNCIVVSDLHCGCQFGLCPPEVTLDGGGVYRASELQRRVWQWWRVFWYEWVPDACEKEPFSVVLNGDTTDGRHHNSISQISQNLSDQRRIAEQVLRPIVEQCEGRLYVVRGTEAHVGQSAEQEEMLAEELGAIPNAEGMHARYELLLRVGTSGRVQIMHHIGTTGSNAYETTALCKEFAEACAEAARWGRLPPDVVVRSHRHRHAETRVPTRDGYGICVVTPGWQLKTPFVWKIPGGRLTTPQFGGVLIRQGDREVYTRSKVWSIDPPPQEEPTYE